MDAQLGEVLDLPGASEWLALCRREELHVGFCDSCSATHFYPRALCPHCHSGTVRLVASRGAGAIYSWTEVQAKPASYRLAYVALDEGCTLLTQLVGDPAGGQWAVGDRVAVQWALTGGGDPLPVFGAAGSRPEGGTP
jgi:uncharacterized OB-fold protein